jgi:hypothetical protein
VVWLDFDGDYLAQKNPTLEPGVLDARKFNRKPEPLA